ncbi:MAG: hypothetical protein KatS3mg113_0856 [Planctomycetaceae bacterium]|nr:MAG: hypothetical protein KatS3mg113_0856 [Planctomycetaceae bacterium]
MPVYLVPIDANCPMITLDKTITLIGRQQDCDVVLAHSKKVSRHHCCIAIVNKDIRIRDLGSTNGIVINGQRIAREAQLNVGDELAIGDVRYVLQKDLKQPAPSRIKTSSHIPVSSAPAEGKLKQIAQGNIAPKQDDPLQPLRLPDDDLHLTPPDEISSNNSSNDSGPLVPSFP